MVVSVGVAVFVDLPLSSLVEQGVRCIRVGESAVQLGVILATSDPVGSDANINNQITLSRRVREVVDDFEIPALQARALDDSKIASKIKPRNRPEHHEMLDSEQPKGGRGGGLRGAGGGLRGL
jgi:hypothetical protein